VIVGAIIGVGLYKGVRNINLRLLGHIASGWVTTPVAAGLLSFFMLFFVKNLFGIEVGQSVNPPAATGEGMNLALVIRYSIIVLLIVISAYLVWAVLAERDKTNRLKKKYYE
jgi:hypothetical protein